MPRFQLLVGTHIEDDPAQPGKDRVYRAGEVFDSKSDLTRFNTPGMTPKFQRIGDVHQPDFHAAHATPQPAVDPYPKTPPPPIASTVPVRSKTEYEALLHTMSAAELKKHAEEEEINLHGAKTKDEMIKACLAAK